MIKKNGIVLLFLLGVFVLVAGAHGAPKAGDAPDGATATEASPGAEAVVPPVKASADEASADEASADEAKDDGATDDEAADPVKVTVTIEGMVEVVDTYDDGTTAAVLVREFDTDLPYFIEPDGKGEELLKLVDRDVAVSGTVDADEEGDRFIVVSSYKILPPIKEATSSDDDVDDDDDDDGEGDVEGNESEDDDAPAAATEASGAPLTLKGVVMVTDSFDDGKPASVAIREYESDDVFFVGEGGKGKELLGLVDRDVEVVGTVSLDEDDDPVLTVKSFRFLESHEIDTEESGDEQEPGADDADDADEEAGDKDDRSAGEGAGESKAAEAEPEVREATFRGIVEVLDTYSDGSPAAVILREEGTDEMIFITEEGKGPDLLELVDGDVEITGAVIVDEEGDQVMKVSSFQRLTVSAPEGAEEETEGEDE